MQQQRPAAGALARLDIAGLVTHHGKTVKVDAMLPRHACSGNPGSGLRQEQVWRKFGRDSIGQVGTIVEGGDPDAMIVEHSAGRS